MSSMSLTAIGKRLMRLPEGTERRGHRCSFLLMFSGKRDVRNVLNFHVYHR